MSKLRELRFADPESLNAALALAVAGCLRSAVLQHNRAVLAVSGGQSPVPLFNRLSRAELDWSRITVTQVDERWLPAEAPESNARLIREHLLQGPASAARFIPLWNGADSARQGQPDREAMLRALPLPFDLILLGMGEDGHTASLFPHAPELGHALTTDALTAATTASVPPYSRLTLTLEGLLRSRALILPLSGASKRAVYAKALEDGPVEDMPIRAVLRQEHVPVEVWIAEGD